jgi:hypothetical protein
VKPEVAVSGFNGLARVGTGTDPRNRFIFRTVKPAGRKSGGFLSPQTFPRQLLQQRLYK